MANKAYGFLQFLKGVGESSLLILQIFQISVAWK